MKAPSLAAQLLTVERAAANHRGHCENLARLVDQRRRPQHELDTARAWLPDLLAAAETMRGIVNAQSSAAERASAPPQPEQPVRTRVAQRARGGREVSIGELPFAG